MEVIFVVFFYLLVICLAIAIAFLPVYFCVKWGKTREIVSGKQTLNSLICGCIGLFFSYAGMLLVYFLPKNVS